VAGSFLVSSTASSDRRLVTRGLVLCYDTYSKTSYPGSGTTLYDLKGNSNATLSGVSISNKYASFDGAASYASFSTSPFNFASNQTIVMVLKPMETDAQRRNPYNHEYAGYGTITHEPSGDFNYYFGTSGGNGATYQGVNSSFTVKENEMAVITLVRSPSTITWYKNGVAGGSVANSYPTAVTSISTAYLGEGYAGFYKGEINFFALYNTALTSAEVLQNYNALYERLPIGTATNGLIFEYDFSNPNYYTGTYATSITDTSGNANNMTFTASPTWASDNGGSMIFDGSTQYGDVTATALSTASVVTIDMWVKWINVNNANNGMFCGFTTYDVWTSGGSLGFNTGAGDLYGLTASQVANLNLVGNYHHYTFVMTKSGSIPSSNQIWIDGVQQTLSQIYGTTTTPPGFANNQFRLANWLNGGYCGNIACSNIRMYNRQLSSTEIVGNYNALKNKFASPVIPSTPTIGTPTAISGGATVAFTPASGSAPSDYYAVSNPGGIVGLGDTSPITVTGLSNSTSYTFQVAAMNGAGASSLSSSSSSVTPSSPTKTINVLIVGGGGAGGSSAGGGGGAGGYVATTYGALTTSYSIVVGAGGAATPTNGNGNPGNPSSAFGFTALGGGQGTAYGGGNGGNGGSGGGGGCQSTSQLGGSSTQSSTYGYGSGNSGGGGSPYTDANFGGGGGGAGSAGTPGTSGGAAGSGLTYQINGSNYGTYAAGGPGGQAGVGQSAKPNATANTGNGGSGSGDNATAGAGGSGIVIISYPTGSLTATGGTISTFNGYTLHTFSSVGTSTWTRTA